MLKILRDNRPINDYFSVSDVQIPGFLCYGKIFPNYLESRKASHRLQSAHLYDQNSILKYLSLARILLL